MKKIKVGFVQLNSSFSGQHYLPLSAGMLEAYATKHLIHPENFVFLPTVYRFMDTNKAAQILAECDIVGFSIYVWNEMNSLAIAKEYKQLNPDGFVVVGGPQVPNSHKQFRRIRSDGLNTIELKRERIGFTPAYHQSYPYIDIACHGEGERVFTKILDQFEIDKCVNKKEIPSISYIDSNGIFHFNNMLPRMTDEDLALAPSPFTTDVFKSIMTMNTDHKWIAMYETDRGCPYMCSYCDWGGATEDKISKFPMDQVKKDILWMGENNIPYVFLCNANFGILKRDTEIAHYFGQAKEKYCRLEGVSTQNAKNPKGHTLDALAILENYGLNKATVMSQQSLNPETLAAVRRDNMKLDEYYNIQKKLASDGVFTMTDLIFPMPGETYESILSAIATLIAKGQHNKIQFNNLSILRNTEMGDPEYQRQYGMNIIKSKIINGHGSKNHIGIDEWQELVVATNTMPAKEWRKTRSLCWMVNLIYFNKLLQFPAIIANAYCDLPYQKFFEIFSSCDSKKYPILTEINQFFDDYSSNIQNGTKEEFIYSADWLGIYWPPEEYMLIKLCKENKLGKFYEEARELIFNNVGNSLNSEPLFEAIKLNQYLIKTPFHSNDLYFDANFNISEFVQSIILGAQVPLTNAMPTKIKIDRTSESWDSWDDWYRKVVWYGNRRGAYLFGTNVVGSEIAGHH